MATKIYSRKREAAKLPGGKECTRIIPRRRQDVFEIDPNDHYLVLCVHQLMERGRGVGVEV
jgi:hypothetical protein